MLKLSMCRICLVADVNMHCLVNTKLQDTYEKLTAMSFNTDDVRPLQVCYICCARLRNCYRLQLSCIRSEQLFNDVLTNDLLKSKQLNDINTFNIKHPVISVSCVPLTRDGVPHTVDGDSMDPLGMIDVHVKEENIKAVQDNITEDEFKDQYKGTVVTLKTEDTDVDDDPRNYNNHTVQVNDVSAYECDEMNVPDNLETEYSILDIVRDFRSIDNNAQDDLETNYCIPAMELNDNCLKPVVFNRKDLGCVETGTSDDKNSRLAMGLEDIQSTLNKTETIFENHIKYKTKLRTKDKHNRAREKVNEAQVHTDEKPYRCDVCKKRFIRKHHLKEHNRIHENEKRYKCDACEKYFRRKHHLLQHIAVHTGDRPYKCKVCKKSFNRNSLLSQHIRVHTGEKPYKCDICEKRFSVKPSLNRHIQVHGRILPALV